MSEERSIYGRALDVINRYGWRQYARGSKTTKACLEGSLNEACHGNRFYCHDSRVASHEPSARHSLMRLRLALGRVPWMWNDTKGRSAEDVALLLKYADADELDTWRELYGPDAS